MDLLGRLLPRHLEIIYEINARFLDEVAMRYPGDVDRLRRMSIIEEGSPQRVRMAYLSIVGSHSVNGVSQLHTRLLRTQTLKDFDEFYPGRFNNKTNGITPRRWLLKANPGLAGLITDQIGPQWVCDLSQLERLLPLADDPAARDRWQAVKRANKAGLAEYIHATTQLIVNPDALYDVQVKRIHEYKRQLLFAFYMVAHYLRLKNDPGADVPPRVFIVGGKAAPSYAMAKLSIKFVNAVAEAVNRDRTLQDRMRVVFLENYRVSLAERIFPASDLSEQISTAGTEASGTGNMKFMLNGALTIGTRDGANIEIADLVGPDNIFLFGKDAAEIQRLGADGYHPGDFIQGSPRLREVLDLVAMNYFSPYHPGLFGPILDSIYNADPFFVCADFDSYAQTQDAVGAMYLDPEQWTRRSILNVAKAGPFSSDRTVREYAREIWGIPC